MGSGGDTSGSWRGGLRPRRRVRGRHCRFLVAPLWRLGSSKDLRDRSEGYLRRRCWVKRTLSHDCLSTSPSVRNAEVHHAPLRTQGAPFLGICCHFWCFRVEIHENMTEARATCSQWSQEFEHDDYSTVCIHHDPGPAHRGI